MVKIRLKRTGAKHQPHYRIVVMPSQRRRNGREIEDLGWYSPSLKSGNYKIDGERAAYWLSKGALATDVVKGFLRKEKKKK